MQGIFQLLGQAVVFWAVVGIWVIVNFLSGRNHKLPQRNKIAKRSDSLVFYSAELGLIIAFVLKLLYPHARLYDTSLFFWFGIALICAGTWLRQVAINTLGTYHVMTIATQENQPVISRGVYRYIRHPSYLGAIIAVVGVALSLNSLIGSIGLVAVTIATLVHRIGIEDTYLSEHLGKSYQLYRQHTFRLIPFVW